MSSVPCLKGVQCLQRRLRCNLTAQQLWISRGMLAPKYCILWMGLSLVKCHVWIRTRYMAGCHLKALSASLCSPVPKVTPCHLRVTLSAVGALEGALGQRRRKRKKPRTPNPWNGWTGSIFKLLKDWVTLLDFTSFTPKGSLQLYCLSFSYLHLLIQSRENENSYTRLTGFCLMFLAIVRWRGMKSQFVSINIAT